MGLNTVLVVVPSRGRPHNIERLIEGWQATADDPLWAQLLVAVDDDDPALPAYREATRRVAFAWLEVQPPAGCMPTLNRWATEYAASFDAIGFMGDDHLPVSKGWDSILATALAEVGTGLVYGDDRLQGAALPTAVFITSCIITALGFMAPPTLGHLYADNYWLALGRRLGRIHYLPHLVIEHVHPVAGKAAMDDGYARVNSAAQDAADHAAFVAWVLDQLEHDVARIRHACLAR
jgi:hypothetical protein